MIPALGMVANRAHVQHNGFEELNYCENQIVRQG